MSKTAILLVLLIACAPLQAERQTENVILITLDGVRIQELFAGMDPLIAAHSESVDYSDIDLARERYWRDTPERRREALMPFFWSTLAPQGIVFGNKEKGSSVKVRNGILWSSPGYAEILTGEPQSDVVDNALVRYPHRTILEFVRAELGLAQEEVAQFGSWDGFKLIAASRNDAFFMNGAYDPIPPRLSSPEMDYLSALRPQIMELWEESANDVVTYRLARAWLQQHRPRLMWLAFGQSDDWAHGDRYDRLLDYLHLVDSLLGDLWRTLDSMEAYKGTTTLVVTTDHGRGLTGGDWIEHDAAIPGSEDIWVAVIGPDTPDKGEAAGTGTVYQADVAATVLQFFGLDAQTFNPDAGPPIPGTLATK